MRADQSGQGLLERLRGSGMIDLGLSALGNDAVNEIERLRAAVYDMCRLAEDAGALSLGESARRRIKTARDLLTDG